MTHPVVCVHGLGYVGLPTAAVLADSGFRVLGYDTDPNHRETIASGKVPYDEPALSDLVADVVAAGDLDVVGEVPAADYHLVCVPTPFVEETKQTDLSYVEAAATGIGEVLRQGDAVILESTVPPGTTDQVVRPILEEYDLTVAEDFTLSFSPETVLPGNLLTELRGNDRLVGSVGDEVPAEVIALYRSFVEGAIHTTDATTAEFVKLVENAYRDTNIAFANETAKLAQEHGIDSREAIRLANEHPRVDILSPGPGVGGHCLPIDPHFLSQDNDRGILIETARAINDGMVDFVTELLADALDSLDDTQIAILGIAYKGGVDDTRQSPGLALADHLSTVANVTVTMTDPRVEDAMHPIVPLDEAVDGSDAAVLVTDHPEYADMDPNRIGAAMAGRVIVDTRSLLDRERWRAAGFDLAWV